MLLKDLNNIFLLLVVINFTIFAQVNNASEEKNIIPDSQYWTYIPLNSEYKDAIYWPIKTISIATTLGFNLLNYSTPFLDNNNSHKIDIWVYHSFKCHQLPDRTFCVHTKHGDDCFPVCSRCLGMYTGFFLGNFDSFIWDSFQIKGWERWHQGLLHIGTYSFFMLPLIIDGSVQLKTDYISNNGWRFTTGILFGFATTAIIDECIQLILDYDFKKSIKDRKARNEK